MRKAKPDNLTGTAGPRTEGDARTSGAPFGVLEAVGGRRKLVMRLTAVISAILFVVAALYLACTQAISSNNVRSKVLTEAQTLAVEMQAVWDYIDASQTAINHNADGTYDFKGIYCAVAGKGIARRFTRDAEGYIIRYVRDDPRTATDEPDPFEQAALETFKQGGSQEYYELVDYDGAPSFRYVSKLTIRHNCLKCHGSPAGEKDETGFIKEGMSAGDLAGAVSIVIPVAAYEAEATQNTAMSVGFFLVLAAGLITAVYMVIKRMVAEPLNRKNIELSCESQEKTELLATMSHELKTPLASIMAFTDIWERSDYPKRPEEERLVQEIRDNSSVLLGMVNDTVDVARLESGRYELRCEDVDVCDVVNAVFAVAEPLAMRRGIELEKSVDMEIPILQTDWEALRKILINFVSNALKFTEAGGSVKVSVRLDEGGSRVRFDVADTGCGIAHEDLERIFYKYERPGEGACSCSLSKKKTGSARSAKLVKRKPGSGLGLYLAKTLAEKLGGGISVASEVGRGSTFTAYIPLKRENEEHHGEDSGC